MKFLIIRLSSIGDIVLTSPIVRCLKKQTDAQVDFICKDTYQSLMSDNPYLNNVWSFETEKESDFKNLMAEKYTAILDLHKNYRSAEIIRKLGLLSNSFNKINVKKWLMTQFKINTLPDVHIVDRMMQSIAYLKVKNDDEGLDFYINPKNTISKEALSGVQEFVVIVLGAAHFTKKIPLDKLQALIGKIKQQVVLLGGANEKEEAVKLTESQANVINKVGVLNLQQSASVIEQSTLVITPDTGMMHIAAAFKKPIISVWGNTIPAFGMAPYYGKYNISEQIIESNGLSCRPCSKIGYDKCPKGHFKCMRNISIDKIIESLGQILKKDSLS